METNWNQIIEACIAGDRKAEEELYRECYPHMIKVCLRYAFGDPANAGAHFNAAMLKVFRSLHQFKHEGAFLGWVRRIVVTVCIDHYRLKLAYKPVEYNSTMDDVLVTVPETYARISGTEIMKLVHELPRNTGVVFNLFVLEGYKHDEIAFILGISPGTSKWHLSEARRLLKQKLDSLSKNSLAHAS